jgi:hypothetical protein
MLGLALLGLLAIVLVVVIFYHGNPKAAFEDLVAKEKSLADEIRSAKKSAELEAAKIKDMFNGKVAPTTPIVARLEWDTALVLSQKVADGVLVPPATQPNPTAPPSA